MIRLSTPESFTQAFITFDLQPLLGILKTDPKDFSFWERISFATGARGTTTTLLVFCEVIWIAPALMLLHVNFSRSLTLNPVKQQKRKPSLTSLCLQGVCLQISEFPQGLNIL